jgi:hypothetical protein
VAICTGYRADGEVHGYCPDDLEELTGVVASNRTRWLAGGLLSPTGQPPARQGGC